MTRVSALPQQCRPSRAIAHVVGREGAWLKARHNPYDFSPSWFRAWIAAVLGRREEAVALLREWRTHTVSHLAPPHYPAEFAPLRDYPPLVELLRVKG